MAKPRSRQGCACGPLYSAQQKTPARSRRFRALIVETLETRALLTGYTYPYGAMPDDTGEYMLGDVAVNVVLMESDPTLAPYDNNSLSDPVHPGRGSPAEDWTTEQIAAIKSNIQSGLQWWKDTLTNMFPSAPANLLNFHINWQYADNPVHTGYEPIDRISNDFQSWMYSFLDLVQFNATGNFSSDIRAYNDFTRQQAGTDWAFTIFVVNNANDFTIVNDSVAAAASSSQFNGGSNLINANNAYKDWDLYFTSGPLNGQHAQVLGYNGSTRTFTFAPNAFTTTPGVGDTFKLQQFDGNFQTGGSFSQAFSYAGGRFMVVPSSRPDSTYAHESGHQFWALDQYTGGGTYTSQRGYYNTQNLNATDNPDFGVNEVQSIVPPLGAVTGGTFRLTFHLPGSVTVTTEPIAYDASASTIQSAINAAASGLVPGWSNGDIIVAGGPLNSVIQPYGGTIALGYFGNSVKYQNLPLVSIDVTNLIGGSGIEITEATPGHEKLAQQQNSLMSSGALLTSSFANHTLDPYAMAQIGWQDSDHNGIFDVLDVPFTLSGSGQYNVNTQLYSFSGSTHVNTLPNLNSSGTQDDITINQINEIQASIDGGPWQSVMDYAPRTYSTNVNVSLAVGAGIHEIRLRSFDTRTHVSSNIFVGETDVPTSTGEGLSGLVFYDQNANGHWDSGEMPIPDVGIDVTDQSDQPLNLNFAVEPSAYVTGTILNEVVPEATLKAIGPGIASPGDVISRVSTIVSNQNKVFTATSLSQQPLQSWNGSQKLQVSFASPVSTVSLRAYGTSLNTSSIGRLEAYDANNTLIARFTTGALTSGGFTTMTVLRPQGDIDHVIAYGHLGSSVVLDTLQWGPAASATTNTNGGYSLGYLPDGTYRIHISPPAGYLVTTPASGYATVTSASGQTQGAVNFGLASLGDHPFHNAANRFNVNNDPQNFISPVDALLVINYLNANSGAEGEIGSGALPGLIGYVDVNNDGLCTPGDALDVINYINAHPPGSGEGEGLPGVGAGGSALASGSAEGEGQLAVPQNAADYYAQQPLHLLNIPGTDQPCTCAACLAARGEPTGSVVAHPAANSSSTSLANVALLRSFVSSATAEGTAPVLNKAQLLIPAAQPSKLSSGWLLARKPSSDLDRVLTDKLDETIDDLAVDVAQASAFVDASE